MIKIDIFWMIRVWTGGDNKFIGIVGVDVVIGFFDCYGVSINKVCSVKN